MNFFLFRHTNLKIIQEIYDPSWNRCILLFWMLASHFYYLLKFNQFLNLFFLHFPPGNKNLDVYSRSLILKNQSHHRIKSHSFLPVYFFFLKIPLQTLVFRCLEMFQKTFRLSQNFVLMWLQFFLLSKDSFFQTFFPKDFGSDTPINYL